MPLFCISCRVASARSVDRVQLLRKLSGANPRLSVWPRIAIRFGVPCSDSPACAGEGSDAVPHFWSSRRREQGLTAEEPYAAAVPCSRERPGCPWRRRGLSEPAGRVPQPAEGMPRVLAAGDPRSRTRAKAGAGPGYCIRSKDCFVYNF
jgi:hypothetical protein